MTARHPIAANLSSIVLFLIIAASFVGCQSVLGPGTAGDDPEAAGKKIAASSFEIDSIEILFSGIQVLRDAGGIAEWVAVPVGDWPESARTFDLLEVVGGLEVILGDATLEPGVYSKMRIVVESASISVGDGWWPLKIAGRALQVNDSFEVGPSGVPRLPLEFEVSKAVKVKPRAKYPYSMNGVLRLGEVAPLPATGSISGAVVPSVYALVTAYVAGTTDVVASVYTDSDSFVFAELDPGAYDLEASAPGYISGWEMGIPLAAGEVSDGHILELQPLGGGEKR